MAASYAGNVNVTSSQVGSYFVGQYYRVLQERPIFAHQFYTDESTMTLVDGDSSQTTSALMQIHKLITSLGFTGIEIKTINSLESWNQGILVMVSGSVRAKDFIGQRRFVQTFFLAPQEKGYFVLNDIFQFIDDETIPQHPAAIQFESQFESQVNVPNTAPEPAVSNYMSEEEAREYVNSVHIEDDTVDKYSLPDQEQLQNPECETVVEETPVEESTASHQNPLITVQDPWAHTVEEPVEEPQRKTYASILRVASGQSVSPAVAQTSYGRNSPPASDWNYPPEPTAQQSNAALSYAPEPPVEEPADESLAVEDEGEFKSVYVRNLPPTVSVSDIEEEFKNFGRILPEGVFLRNRKDIGVCYAFVEFEDIVGVQTALQASPIQLGGRHVYIEERRANNSSSFRGGRRGRGRGSFQPEASRGGRFSGRSSGRGSNQNGSDYNRSRGNGFYQRSSR